jgi:tetratricopeptide (TPR) repeat protein
VEANGGHYSRWMSRAVSVVVVGHQEWPLTGHGRLRETLRDARRLMSHERQRVRVLSEDEFLSALGLEHYRQNIQRLYTTSTLTELLGVPREKLRGWVAAGLLRPAKVEYGVHYFDFRQASSAKRLVELVRSGMTVRRLNVVLEQMRRWLPEASEPLEQLAVIENKRHLLMRLEDGELIEPDGQLHLDFTTGGDGDTFKLMPGPRTARDWFVQGVEQEREGYLAEAAESYRQALLIGGPDADACFNLANVHKAQGKRERAMERYFQTVEIDNKHVRAWTNLGMLLVELGRPADACAAFQKAIAVDPTHSMPRYNLAATLDDLHKWAEAAEHWRAYLRYDQTSECAAYARRRVAEAPPLAV